jgi:hypothetical protein
VAEEANTHELFGIKKKLIPELRKGKLAFAILQNFSWFCNSFKGKSPKALYFKVILLLYVKESNKPYSIKM